MPIKRPTTTNNANAYWKAKVYYLEGKATAAIKRFTIPKTIEFDALRDMLTTKLPANLAPTAHGNIQYQDDEDDWVTLASAEDWAAVGTCTDTAKLLRIRVQFLKKKSKPQAKKQSDDTAAAADDNKKRCFGRRCPRRAFWANRANQCNNNSNCNKQQKAKPEGKIVHHGIVCDGCNVNNIEGTRYKCVDCRDFDYCDLCFQNLRPLQHDKNHTFKAMATPAVRGGRRCHGGRFWGSNNGPRFCRRNNHGGFHCNTNKWAQMAQKFAKHFSEQQQQQQQQQQNTSGNENMWTQHVSNATERLRKVLEQDPQAENSPLKFLQQALGIDIDIEKKNGAYYVTVDPSAKKNKSANKGKENAQPSSPIGSSSTDVKSETTKQQPTVVEEPIEETVEETKEVEITKELNEESPLIQTHQEYVVIDKPETEANSSIMANEIVYPEIMEPEEEQEEVVEQQKEVEEAEQKKAVEEEETIEQPHKYAKQLKQLADMGFISAMENVKRLMKWNGNINRVVASYVRAY
mgnify:CR=1 FL=1